VRGYDRHAVDAYRKRVNRAIAELKVSASPQLGGETVGGGEAGDGAKSPPTVTEESAHAAAAVEPPPLGLDENDSKGTPPGLA
jgi:hypothetical protein